MVGSWLRKGVFFVPFVMFFAWCSLYTTCILLCAFALLLTQSLIYQKKKKRIPALLKLLLSFLFYLAIGSPKTDILSSDLGEVPFRE